MPSINWGGDETSAPFTSELDETSGNLVLAEDNNGNTVLLEWDGTTWQYRGPIEMNGEDVSGVGTLTATDVVADSVNTDDATVNNSVTWPDGTSTSTSPSPSSNLQQVWQSVGVYDIGPTTDWGTWQKDTNNPILSPGSSGTWDDGFVRWPFVITEGDTHYMIYSGAVEGSAGTNEIGLATSTDLTNWTKDSSNPILSTGASGEWDSGNVIAATVLKVGDTYYLFYQGNNGSEPNEIGLATSTDLTNWTKYGGNPVLSVGSSGAWDDSTVLHPNVIREGDTFYLFYAGGAGNKNFKIGVAESRNLVDWTRNNNNPVLSPGASGDWDDVRVQAPRVMLLGDTYYMFYDGRSGEYESERSGIATSTDLINWTKDPANPIIAQGASGEWDSGVLTHPQTIQNGNSFETFYTASTESSSDLATQIGRATLKIGTPANTTANGTVTLSTPEAGAIEVHSWPTDAGSGSTVTDTVGSADGTITNATWVSDAGWFNGAALDYNGTDATVDYPTKGPSGSLSAVATAEFDSLPGGGEAMIIIGGYYSDGGQEWKLDVDENQNARMFVRTTDGSFSAVSNTTLTTGTKYRILGVWDEDAGQAEIHINDALENTTSGTGTFSSSNMLELNTGARSSDATTDALDGRIDYPRVFGGVVTDSQRNDDYTTQPWT